MAKFSSRWTHWRQIADDQVVAQVIEPVLVVGAVGDVRAIGLRPRAGAEGLQPLVGGVIGRIEEERGVVLNDADGQSQRMVQLRHPLGIALGEVVVHGDEMDALAFERIQIDRQRRDQGLAFAGLHFRDAAPVQNHAADELHVEVPHVQPAAGHLAADGEGFGQDVVERLAVGQALS